MMSTMCENMRLKLISVSEPESGHFIQVRVRLNPVFICAVDPCLCFSWLTVTCGDDIRITSSRLLVRALAVVCCLFHGHILGTFTHTARDAGPERRGQRTATSSRHEP